jgi:hypothetical protein
MNLDDIDDIDEDYVYKHNPNDFTAYLFPWEEALNIKKFYSQSQSREITYISRALIHVRGCYYTWVDVSTPYETYFI